jgi:hypothetical protein
LPEKYGRIGLLAIELIDMEQGFENQHPVIKKSGLY